MTKRFFFRSLSLCLVLVCTLLPFIGCAKGDPSLDFQASVFDENGLTGDTVNPAKNGDKITVINFWGVWCPYCLIEMPDFDRIATEYKDRVRVIAIHTTSRSDEADEYVAEDYADSEIVFAFDEAGQGLYASDVFYEGLGGTGSYPYTLIVDQSGEIVFSQVGATNYAALKAQIESLLHD